MAESRAHPPALPHGDIEEVFSNVFIVKGTIEMKQGFLTFAFSRNMVIIREDSGELILIHSLRLNEEGLKELDKLGIVKHVIRLAGYHGMDDPFYKERYGATIWAIDNTRYVEGFDVASGNIYFTPDETINKDSKLPIKESSLIVIQSANPPEGLLLVKRPEGSVLIAGDALQNWGTTDRFFNCLGRVIMQFMGFIKAYNVGPAWYQTTKPDKEELQKLLLFRFDHLLPVHGEPVIGQAWKKYEPAIKALK